MFFFFLPQLNNLFMILDPKKLGFFFFPPVHFLQILNHKRLLVELIVDIT